MESKQMMKIVRTCIFVFLGAVLMPVNAMEWQALPDKAPAPADNPTTPEKVELGQLLYYGSTIFINRDSFL